MERRGHKQDKRSKKIDKLLKKEQETPKRIKILLLGPEGAGKSTFLRHIKILFQNGFSADEIAQFKTVIYDNIMTSIKQIIQFADTHALIRGYLHEPIKAIYLVNELNAEIGAHIRTIWQDESIKKAWERRNEFNVMSNAEYYFDEIDRIAQKEYTPTNYDILRANVRSTVVEEIIFELASQYCRKIVLKIGQVSGLEFHIIDPSGLNGDHRKWLHSFEDVSIVIFFAALDTYDKTVESYPTDNQMTETLKLFNCMTGSKWLNDKPFILCFTKTDLFEEKITRSPLNALFHDYRGGGDSEQGLAYILDQFKLQFAGRKVLYHTKSCVIASPHIGPFLELIKKAIIDAAMETFWK